MVSKDELLEMKKTNEERRKFLEERRKFLEERKMFHEKKKKSSREESYNRKWNWDDNKHLKKIKDNKNETTNIEAKDNAKKIISNNSEIKSNTKNIVSNNFNSNSNSKKKHKISKRQRIIAEDHSNNSIFDEEWNPIDSIAYYIKATWKSRYSAKNFSFKKWVVEENNRIHRKRSFDLNNIEDLRKICDREWDYVHELQRILFSYFAMDIENTRVALSKIDDKYWEILKLFEEELWNAMEWWLDFFHRWEISAIGNDFEYIIDTVVWLHKWLEKVKEQINKKIKNPEDELPTIYPFYNWIHGHSPRNKK